MKGKKYCKKLHLGLIRGEGNTSSMFQQLFVAGPVLPEVVRIDLNSSLLNKKVSAAVEGSFAVNPQRAECASRPPLFSSRRPASAVHGRVSHLSSCCFQPQQEAVKTVHCTRQHTHCRRLVAAERTGESSGCTSRMSPSSEGSEA